LARRLCGHLTGPTDLASAVFVMELAPPPGWADMASFNAALAEELRRLHGVDRRAPIDQSLRGGTQTFGDLFALGHPLVDALRTRIAQAVTTTIANLPAAADHPEFGAFLSRRPPDPTAWRFQSAWSSRLTSGGFHTDHVHPDGWMSSAYYVSVPESAGNTQLKPGWLRFGVPDFPLQGIEAHQLMRHTVQPAPGLLVLFPSMLWHGTTPFDDDAERLTIAFDLVPE
jgi:hypothetical protein